jgi:hypothetical protein
MHDLAKVVRDKPVILRTTVMRKFGNFPPGHIGMNAIQKSNHLHKIRERFQQVVIFFVWQFSLDIGISFSLSFISSYLGFSAFAEITNNADVHTNLCKDNLEVCNLKDCFKILSVLSVYCGTNSPC